MSKLPQCWSALVAAGCFLAAPVAFGQAADPGKPCQADVKKICPGVKPGHGRILACLEGKTDQLSDACKEVIKTKLQDFYTACGDDATKFCAGVDKGQGKVVKCLYKKEASLSDSCKAQFTKMKAAAAAHGVTPPPAQ